jgi:ligand-binding SRPBCC domain-containing protein
MNIIQGARGSGKTTKLIQACAEHGGYIVCRSRDEAYRIDDLAVEMGVQIPFPLTYWEFQHNLYHEKGVRKIHIDDADDLLRYIAQGLHIESITITQESAEGEG